MIRLFIIAGLIYGWSACAFGQEQPYVYPPVQVTPGAAGGFSQGLLESTKILGEQRIARERNEILRQQAKQRGYWVSMPDGRLMYCSPVGKTIVCN